MYKWLQRCRTNWYFDRRNTHMSQLAAIALCLYYVFFGHGCYLLRRFVDIFKDPPIPLLPHVSDNVNENSIEAPTFLLWHLACHLLPPSAD